MNKILFIDNNRILSDKLSPYLSADKIIIEHSDSVADNMSRILSGSYCLILINISACQEWTQFITDIRKSSKILIIAVSGKINLYDEITALRIGADDFISTAIEPFELAAHIQAWIRRYTQYSVPEVQNNNIHEYKELVINLSGRTVFRNGKEIALTKTEFNILDLFVRHSGQTLTKEQIYSGVWNGEYIYDDRNIITHIQRLRHKIEDDPENPKYIHTVRGIGYQFHYQKK